MEEDRDRGNFSDIGDMLSGRSAEMTSSEENVDSLEAYETALEKSTNLSFDVTEQRENYAALQGESGTLVLKKAKTPQQDTRIIYSQGRDGLFHRTADSSFEASFYVSQAFRKDYTSF